MKYLKQLEINVPILPEQKKIVSEVEKYETEIKKAEALLAELEAKRKTVLLKYVKAQKE